MLFDNSNLINNNKNLIIFTILSWISIYIKVFSFLIFDDDINMVFSFLFLSRKFIVIFHTHTKKITWKSTLINVNWKVNCTWMIQQWWSMINDQWWWKNSFKCSKLYKKYYGSLLLIDSYYMFATNKQTKKKQTSFLHLPREIFLKWV